MFQDILSDQLKQNEMTYSDFLKEVLKPDGSPDIFMLLTALRLYMKVPLIVYKPYLAQKGSRNVKRGFQIRYWYAKGSDKKMAIVDVKMHYCYNGIDYIVQCQPTPLAELNKTVENLHETLDEASDHAKEILKMVPSSEFKNSLKMALKSITTAMSIISQTWTATGTANLAAIISPQPAVVVSSHPVSSHSCPPDSSGKRKAETVSTPPD